MNRSHLDQNTKQNKLPALTKKASRVHFLFITTDHNYTCGMYLRIHNSFFWMSLGGLLPTWIYIEGNKGMVLHWRKQKYITTTTASSIPLAPMLCWFLGLDLLLYLTDAMFPNLFILSKVYHGKFETCLSMKFDFFWWNNAGFT